MEKKHTPGPLIVTHRTVIERPVKIREHFAIAPVAGPTLAFLPEGRLDVQEANAHLFAAAPLLLTELQNIANAKWSNFDSADEFRLWAQNRARFTVAKVKKV